MKKNITQNNREKKDKKKHSSIYLLFFNFTLSWQTVM